MGGSDYLLEPLTQREGEILRLLAQGLSDREIAEKLILAQGTVKWYNKQLYGKLGVHSRTDAVARARELGLLEDTGITWPGGTVTFLFTDIEGSTKLWQRHPEAMREALERHDALLRRAIDGKDGRVFKTVGDAFCAVFGDTVKALSAAYAAQTALMAQDWGETPIRVRMALHTGTADIRDDDYFGPPVNYVARLRSAGHGGQILVSAAARELVHQRLPEGFSFLDLGQHRLKDLEHWQRIFQLRAPELPDHYPPLIAMDLAFDNLPAQRTSFVGRERELSEVKRLLDRTRLLTLTGPPGTGKTRLGLRVGAEIQNQFEDGVYFVDLAPISDRTLVVSTIAQVFGIREAAGQSLLKTLQIYLRDKNLLLLIDNFEQVINAAPLIGELLDAAPGVKALVTSREALRIYGEQEYSVSPLAVPEPELRRSLQTVSQYEAVELFCQRATAVKPDFSLTEENIPHVCEICVRLDGLPLAIELVAARSKLLSPKSMCARLESRLLTLSGGSRDLPARLRTLHGAIDWSYDLLEPEEKVLFTRLAVFQGGRSVDAVEDICSHGLALDILEGLESLLNKSLLRQDVGLVGEPRFVMLEVLHEYAGERLDESSEAEDVKRQHAEYFLALAERASLEMGRADHSHWSLLLRDEHNNLRTALAWSLGGDNATLGLQLAGALNSFWFYEGHSAEGLVWTRRALESAEDAPAAVRARALNAAGRLSWDQGDHINGKVYNREALALYQALEDEVGRAWALIWLSAHALASPGECQEGIELCETGLELFRDIGNEEGIIFAVNVLGELARLAGDYEQAGVAYEESLAIAREEGIRLRQALPLANLSYVAYQQGRYKQAEDSVLEGLALLLEIENTRYVPQHLAILAGPVAAQGDGVKAARLLGASEALRETLGVSLQPGDLFEIKRYVAAVREQLDQGAFETAWSQGRAMSLEEAVGYALGNEID